MDNDVNLTDYCIGFDTAGTVAGMQWKGYAITAKSHRAIMVL